MDRTESQLREAWAIMEDGDAVSRANAQARKADIQRQEADLAMKKSSLAKQKASLTEDSAGALSQQLAESVKVQRQILAELTAIRKLLS